jgi:hypothetical protein
MRKLSIAAVLSVVVFGIAAAAGAAPPPQVIAGAANGLVPVRAAGGKNKLAGDMTFHGGTVLTTSFVQAIFWGTRWADSSFAGDKITGLDTFYVGVGGSRYAGTNTEYFGSNGQVTTATSYAGHTLDTQSSLGHAPKTSAVLAEVAQMVADPVPNGYYPVYTDLPRGHAQYCAWHSWGSVGGVNVQFAFFFALDGDSQCDPLDNSGLHSQGLAALANVSGHEFSEATTDPRGDGWFDSTGAENGDKCAWSFGADLLTFSNSSQWKIQGNWSNVAFDASSGFPNSSGQLGCIGTS